MTKNDIIIFIACAMVGSGSVIGTIVVAALKIQRAIIKEFEAHRRFVYMAFRQRDRAIRRLELWAIRRDTDERYPYQPGVDPLDFGDNNENGEAH